MKQAHIHPLAMSTAVRDGRPRTGRSLSQSLSLMLALCLLFVVGCGGSPTAPAPPPAPIAQSVTPPSVSPLLCVSGQSNAYNLLPFLGTPTVKTIADVGAPNQSMTFISPTAQGWAAGGQVIDYWNEGQPGWSATAPLLTPTCGAFVWFQGEADEAVLGFSNYPPRYYETQLVKLLQRVRARTSPILPTFVVQVAPRYVEVRDEQRAACTSDPTCRLIPTDDLAFPDGTHLDEASYKTLAARIVAAAR